MSNARSGSHARRRARAKRRIRRVARLTMTLLAVVLIINSVAPRLFAADPTTSPSGSPRIHVVSNGETLWSLARSVDSAEDPREVIHEITVLNGLTNARIFPGQRLILPSR